MAIPSINHIAESIYLASREGKADHKMVKNTVEFLARKGLLSKSPQILSRLEKIIHEKEGKISARISSKEKLSEHTKKEISQILSRRHAGKQILIDEKEDKNLLGGFKIEINDEVIDLTLRNKIKKLKEHLTRPA